MRIQLITLQNDPVVADSGTNRSNSAVLRRYEGKDFLDHPCLFSNQCVLCSDQENELQQAVTRLALLTPVFSPFAPGRVKNWKGEKELYRRLKEVPDKALAASGYSDIDLAKLFQAFSSLK